MMFCHTIESTAAHKFSGGSGKNETLKELERASLCAEEAVTAVKPKFKKAQAELSKRPSAVEKLKGYTAAYLSAMGRIPRAELTPRVLETLQKQEQKIVKDREAELDVELLSGAASCTPPPYESQREKPNRRPCMKCCRRKPHRASGHRIENAPLSEYQMFHLGNQAP